MDGTAPAGARPAIRSAHDARALVVNTITEHAESLLTLARQHSLCADDAYDAYQRGLEIFLRHAPGLDAERAHSWLLTVVKREAWEVRRQRQRQVPAEEFDFDLVEARHAASPEDEAIAFEDVAESAEALRDLKPHELQALWLRASGRSYAEIATTSGWSARKVERCIVEGRARLRKRLAAIQEGAECERWTPVLSAMVDGEADAADVARARPHLRNCPACRASLRQMHQGTRVLALVLPVALTTVDTAPAADPGGLFVRVYEGVSAFAHERAVASVLKLQALTDVASTGKVAAVAASAAALAGGGAVVAGDVAERHRPAQRHAIARKARARPPAPPVARPAGAGVVRSAGPATPAAQPRHRPAAASKRVRRRDARQGEFGAEAALGGSAPVVRRSAPAATGTATTASLTSAPPPSPAPTRSAPAGAATREFAP